MITSREELTISLRDIENAYILIKEKEFNSLANKIIEDYIDRHQEEYREYLKKYFYEELETNF